MSASNPEKTNSPPPASLVTVKVNGRPVEVPRTMPHPVTGKPVPTTMIQACEAVQVAVPHYCYHHKLPVAGNCRMCLVEYGTPVLGPDRKPLKNPDGSPVISKAPNPAIACATPIMPGMEIYTNTPAVESMRKAVLEFLLINHPLDCPICDQAGECKLQEYAVEYGQTASRFVEEKVHKPKQVDLGPRILLDDERCILCTRCIRFTREVVGDDCLGIVNRGSHNTLTHYPGRPFDNNYTLNTVDLCPVGALTSKDFRFQSRVWFLKRTKSVCTSCATGCNIVIGSRENRIYRYEPRENEAVNSCWMCDQGRLNYRWIGREDRLQNAVIQQTRGQFVQVPWSQAMDQLLQHLRKIPSGSLAILASARQSNEELFLAARLGRRLGAIMDSPPRTGADDRLLMHADKNPNTVGARLLGIAASQPGGNLGAMAEGICRGDIRTLLALGEDAVKHLGQSVVERLDQLIVCDILPNQSTPQAHILLPGCAPAEKWGTFVNRQGRLQKFGRAVEAPGQAQPEWQFLRQAAQDSGGESIPASVGGIFDQMARETPAFHGITWAGLGDLGATLPI